MRAQELLAQKRDSYIQKTGMYYGSTDDATRGRETGWKGRLTGTLSALECEHTDYGKGDGRRIRER